MLPQPQGLIFQQYAKGLSESESAAVHLEQKHAIQPRWTADSSEYQAAALQRKCFHVHRLQHKIVTDVDWLRSSYVVSTNPRPHRGTSTQLKKTAQDARDRLKQTIKEMQAWHAIPADIGHVAYDVASLQVEDLQQPSWKAPWTASGQFVSALRDATLTAAESTL